MEWQTSLKQFQMDYQWRFTPGVLKATVRVLTQFLNYTNKNLGDITKKDIRNWMIHLQQSGCKQSTVKRSLTCLRTYFKYCKEEGFVLTNPAKEIPSPKLEELLPRYLTIEQLTRLRKLNEGKLLRRTIIEVLYTTGVRISELLNMKIEDINWNERYIAIPEGKGKKERIVLFTQECGEYLKMHLEKRHKDSPYVFVSSQSFPKPYTVVTIDNWFRQYTERLGFKVTPHMLRHTFAAHLARKGMPIECISILLGHDQIHTTHIYAKLYDQARKEQYDEWM